MDKLPSIKLATTKIDSISANVLVVGFFKEKIQLNPDLKNLDAKSSGIISEYIKSGIFKAEKGETRSLFLNKAIRNIVLVGLGQEKKYNLEIFSNLMADVSRRIRDSGFSSFTIHIDSFSKFEIEEATEKAAMSCLVGLYKFIEYKTKEKDSEKYVDAITFLSNSSKNLESAIEIGKTIAHAMIKTKDIINTPPNVATPVYMADHAKKIAKENGLKCTIIDEKQAQKMGMDCFICVSKGSKLAPRLVVLEYTGAGKEKPLVIVGKGVTFDSGGLNLKPYPYILNMKDDKGGATAALHIIEAAAKLKMKVNLITVTPFCENMPGGNAYRPDDVYKAYNGMTVEIKNTDAEGRMILADALTYASKLKPKAIVDIATLTGASLIALGFFGTPFLSNNEELSAKLKEASKKSMERLWELPLWAEYDDQIKSDVADLKHISEEGDAGVIIGATFLKNFIDDVPWAHIDIGTTVWSKGDKGILTKGATGATVRLMVELIRNWK